MIRKFSRSGLMAAATLALASVSPAAWATLQINLQSATISTVVYAGPGALGMPSADGSLYQSDVQRLAAGTFGSAELSAGANVSNQLNLGAGARYESIIDDEQLTISSGLAFSQVRNASAFTADMAAGVQLRAQGRLVFTATEDTAVRLSQSRVVMSDPPLANSANFQSSYTLARVAGLVDAIDPVTGLPALLTAPVQDLPWDTDTVLRAGTYVLSVDNLYTPAAWQHQYTAVDLFTGQPLTVTTPNTGFVNSLVASSSITLRTTALTSTVPEPGAWALMGLGLMGLSLAVARRPLKQR